MKRFIGVLFVVAGVALSASAKQATTCEERCKETTKTCIDMCTEKGGKKMAAQCKQICNDGQKYCVDKCQKKGN